MKQGGGEHIIAHQDRNLIVIGGIDRCLAATLGAFVNHVVVNETGRMKQFQAHSSMLGHLRNLSEILCHEQHEHGSHAFSAALTDVCKGLSKKSIRMS